MEIRLPTIMVHLHVLQKYGLLKLPVVQNCNLLALHITDDFAHGHREDREQRDDRPRRLRLFYKIGNEGYVRALVGDLSVDIGKGFAKTRK